MSHTPSPWLIADDSYQTFVYALNENGTNRFDLSVRRGYERQPKHSEGSRTSTEEIQANARLIAAAPDLLDVLEKIRARKHLELPASLWIEILDAISKARGVTP